MDFKDYYAILGVAHSSDGQAIKQAYHRLARQYHPDLNPGNHYAEERFKEISEAYQVLSNAEHRRRYDALLQHGSQWQQHMEMPDGFDWKEWLFVSDYIGYNFFFNVLDAFFDLDEKPEHWNSPNIRGEDLEVTVEVSLEEALTGVYRPLIVGQRHIEVFIPPGVQHGTELLVEKEGSPGAWGREPGDLYVIVQERPHPCFKRKGRDLATEISIDIYTALLGGTVSVPTLDEREATLTIPSRTQANSVFCLHHHGMPTLNQPANRGHLYVQVSLSFPELLTETEFDVLCRLAEEYRQRNGEEP